MIGKPKLCIVSPRNYALFNPACREHFGGLEMRVGLIAKELARRGRFDVSLVVADHGQPHIEIREGVTLYSWKRAIQGIGPLGLEPQIRAVWALLPASWRRLLRRWLEYRPRPSSRASAAATSAGRIGSYEIKADVMAIHDEAGADIYMAPGNSQFTAMTAFYCRQRGKKCVFLAASDLDYDPGYPLHPDGEDVFGVPFVLKAYAIEHATAHIVQTQQQARMLRAGYGRSATVIANPVDLARQFPRDAQDVILWVGRSLERIKRPTLVLRLARELPAFRFVIIMNLAVPEDHRRCLREAKGLRNVEFVERVALGDIERYFASARLHVNTSTLEGFPNTFLQAAKYGVPTVSLRVDPGEMLSSHGAGVACGDDFSLLKEATRRLMTDDAARAQLEGRAISYIREHHDKAMIIPKYEGVLASL